MPSADDIYKQAVRLGRSGQIEAAVTWLHSHRNDVATHAPALGLMGTLLSMHSQPGPALGYFMRSIALNPAQPVALSDMGVALTKLNRPDEALACFDQALSLDPRNAQALNNRSNHWLAVQQGELALRDAEAALALQPRLMAAHRQRARALLLLDRPSEALESIAKAVGLDPDHAQNHAAAGEIFDALGRHEDAITAFDRAVARSPADFSFARACSHLRHREFRAGWHDYLLRWNEPGFVRTSWVHDPALLERRDTDNSRPIGQRVLVVDEQGIGDEIMFASLIPDLLRDALSVTWVANARLQRLLLNAFPEVEFVAGLGDLDLKAFDRFLPAGDLCALYRNSLESFPRSPYLRPSSQATARWKARLGPPRSLLRIGLSWKGGVFNTGQNSRSVSLNDLRPLLDRRDCEFVSLQYGDVQAEIEATNRLLAAPIRCFPKSEIDDFEDLAGLVLALDAVVSVQTALVHLAGAVGAPCFAMIPTSAEWRYGDQGDSMPWYNSVKLARQTQPGDWHPVVAQIGMALNRLADTGLV
jgi:tetratricopeptide (TPR) repeat protein